MATDAQLDRFNDLIEHLFLRGLTEAEAHELQDLKAVFTVEDDVTYGPVIAGLEALERHLEEEGDGAS